MTHWGYGVIHLERQRSTQPKLLHSYYLPKSATPYPVGKVRFGMHHRHQRSGEPKERGYFIPKPGDDVAAPLTNDVFKDHRGLLWVTDKERGLDVIEYKN